MTNSQEKEQPQLFIEVIQAKNLPKPNKKSTSGSPKSTFCQIEFEKKKLETNFRSFMKPVWNEQFLFLVKNPEDSKVKLKFFLHLGKKKHLLLGSLEIPTKKLSNEQPLIDWFEIAFSKNTKKSNDKPISSLLMPKIQLKLHFTFTNKHLKEEKKELVWRKDFQQLVDLALKDSNLVLTTLTDVVHSGDADKVAQLIVSVLRHYNKIVPFINFSIDREVQKTRSPQQLFRTNSMATKMMVALKTPSTNAYITSVLKKPVLEILKIQEEISLDSEKTTEEERKTNLELIKKLSQKFFDNVFHSSNIIPWEYKEICYHMHNSVKKKFPEYVFISVAGFIFLRVLCPSIINPSSFLKLSEPVTSNKLKNLVFVAKIIQTFVNGIKFGIKDENLLPLNKWSDENRPKLNEFILKVSSKIKDDQKDSLKKNNKDIPYFVPSQYLFDLLNIFNKYYNAMSTILYVPEKENEEESMSLFLNADDPSVELAILLNILKVPESPLAKKSHTVPNSEILKNKAMKITQMGNDTELLTQGEDDPYVLNSDYTFGGKIPRKATVIGEEVIGFFKGLLNEFEVKDQDNNNTKDNEMTKKSVSNNKMEIISYNKKNNWKIIKKSTAYSEFVLELSELKKLKLEELNLSEKIAFWINIYNSLLIHGSIVNKSIPESNFHLKTFNSQYKYNIAGLIFSRDDIYQGLLKSHPDYFPKNDRRRAFILPKYSFIPLMLFALSDLQMTSPEIRIFHSKDIDKELLFSCKTYIQDFVHIKNNSNKIILSNLFKWNLEIFGGTDDAVINFILEMLSLLNNNLYQKFLQITKNQEYRVEYQNLPFYSKNTLKFKSSSKKLHIKKNDIQNSINFSFTNNFDLEQTFKK
ncbi:ras gtpase-activating protein [Anaeramoeba flamelloides]|uniref:Ras gtpase-activating protein n=1 Tax=Anaeramoeba flamelloides TaxID=1746091 RepID=A0ABQ8YIT3_9EUKA|nr:ras gtpase-activating protein [Anaeramoeba flamelloides]